MDERELFEADYKRRTGTPVDLRILRNGNEYLDGVDGARNLNVAWEAWQARAALAAQPAASAEPSDEACKRLWNMVEREHRTFSDRLLAYSRALLSRYGRPAGDAQPVLYTTEFNGHLQTSTHATQAEAETFARNVNALRRMDREACLVIPLYRDAPVAAQKADDARDAERFEWLCDQQDVKWQTYGGEWIGASGSTLREIIDAAIAQQRKGGQS